jgi:pimeloyl-ACP methyl ester carboxylesterase
MAARRMRVNEVELHVVDEGRGPAVLLLHGFPDSSHLWRHQIPALVAAGFRAIAPDLRGFGKSDKPAQVKAYGLRTVLKDVVGLMDALALDKAHVICHDFGAALGWLFAALHPARVGRFVPMSVGSLQSFSDAGLEQREKSWYMLLFQFGVAEEIIMRDAGSSCAIFPAGIPRRRSGSPTFRAPVRSARHSPGTARIRAPSAGLRRCRRYRRWPRRRSASGRAATPTSPRRRWYARRSLSRGPGVMPGSKRQATGCSSIAPTR